jgi:hypothetical protein
MKDTDQTSRRQFIAGSAAVATTALASTEASAQTDEFVIDPPDVISMEVVGTDQRFPVRRVFCLGPASVATIAPMRMRVVTIRT